ncbi:hypothetical protein C0J52_13614 [Blattella germanica]|nr:hypothetical protein C0J52_13614 [Blattella germanica]
MVVVVWLPHSFSDRTTYCTFKNHCTHSCEILNCEKNLASLLIPIKPSTRIKLHWGHRVVRTLFPYDVTQTLPAQLVLKKKTFSDKKGEIEKKTRG